MLRSFSCARLFFLIMSSISDVSMALALQMGTSHKQSNTSPQDRPRVLYGIETCAGEAYEQMMTANLETWAGTVPRERLVVVGGSHDDYAVGLAATPLNCDDSREYVDCKEASLLLRAVDRARQLDADWLVLGQDDKYIWTEEMRKALGKFDHQEPAIFGGFGCGKGTEHACTDVWEKGGLCGGGTYVVSRGALEKLVKADQSREAFLAEFTTPTHHGASDISASCVFYNRSFPMTPESSLTSRFYSMDPAGFDEEALHRAVEKLQTNAAGITPLTIHFSAGKESIPQLVQLVDDALFKEEISLLNRGGDGTQSALQRARTLHKLFLDMHQTIKAA